MFTPLPHSSQVSSDQILESDTEVKQKKMTTITPSTNGSLLPPAPNVSMVNYDFEEYALEHGIPATLDPLPYRKAGSVFATGEEAEPVMTSAKHDPRLRTVVCRHWLRDLCMKGAACEFLHQYDLSKMPLCRHGDRCKVKDCPFRHISEADRLECVFYSQGFCIHGPFCRYKHLQRDRADLPAVADFTLGLSQMQAGKDGMQQRRPAPKPNEFYKVSLCKHFIQGECPFGEGCHFAHGEHELKKFPRGGANNENEDGNASAELTENMFGNQETTTVDYFQGGASGGGKPSPILEPEHATFFILNAATQSDLAISTVKKEWWVQAQDAQKVNEAVKNGKKVMLFFTVANSDHIQGAVLLQSEAKPSTRNAKRSKDTKLFSYRIEADWYRTVELRITTAVEAAPDLLLPNRKSGVCQELTPSTGEAVMKAVWNSPITTLYESFTGLDPPSDDAILSDFRAPPLNEISWPTMPGPGFLFGCNSQNMDECLGRGILGLPNHMKGSAAAIKPGSAIFLYNVTDRLLFGIFEALTPAMANIEPTAFSKNPKATTSPFPIQIRFRVVLECPPVEEADPVLNDILRNRKGGRIGPLTHAQAVGLGSLLASQCGALQYMTEYKAGRGAGKNVQAPPIALPPKIIEN